MNNSPRWWTLVGPLGPVVALVGFVRPWVWASEYPPTGDWVGHLSAFGFDPLHSFTVDWWGGHPLWYFYFPLPFWTVQLAGAGPLAAKAVGVLPVVALPAAAWLLARCHDRSEGEATLWGFLTAGYVLAPFSHREGGFLLSALVGEFNYSWALLLSVLCLAAARKDRHKTAGLLLAAGLLSHPIPTVFAGLALIRKWKVWVPAVGLTAWWWIPAAVRVPWANSRQQIPVPWPWDHHGGGWWLWIVAAAAVVGVHRWRSWEAPPSSLWFGLWPFAYFLFQGVTGTELPLWNGRVRPLFILVMFWAAATAAWWAVGTAAKKQPSEWATIAGLVVLVLSVFQPDAWRNGTLKTWQLENDTTTLRGSWDDMPEILDRLRWLPRSIVVSEYTAELSTARLGWELPKVGQRSAIGVYYESARSAPWWSLTITQLSRRSMIDIWGHVGQYPDSVNVHDPERGVEKARALGARWLILTLETARSFPDGLIVPVWEGDWLGLYDTKATSVLKVVDVPTVEDDGDLWEWWDEHALSWARPVNIASDITDRRVVFEAPEAGPWTVTVSCFPGWRVTTGGTVGCGPSGQLLVTPDTPGVTELVWETGPVETVGWLGTLLGAAAAAWVWTQPPRARSTKASTRRAGSL